MPHRLVILSLIAALSSCATKQPPPGLIPTAPAKVASALPAVATVRSNQDASGIVSRKLENQVAVLVDKTATLQSNLVAAVELADKLRKQKSATEGELEQQWNQLTAITASHLALEKQVVEAKATADEQAAMRIKSDAAVDALTAAVTAKENETETLRAQNSDLSSATSRLNTDVQALTAAKNKAEKNAAVGSYLKWMIGSMVVVILLIVVGYILLRTYIPKPPL